MKWRLPCTSAALSEARLYAIESIGHTMDYEGWEDQHKKLERLTYGKFAQLWVYEFCRLNKIDCQKDRSGPKEPDNKDLTICGYDVDVKTSVRPELLGQISPGMYKKQEGFYCFVLTDSKCSFIMPYCFLHCSNFGDHSEQVKEKEIIPGTNIPQRFKSSRFLRPGAPTVQFLDFMQDAKNGDIRKHVPFPQAAGM